MEIENSVYQVVFDEGDVPIEYRKAFVNDSGCSITKSLGSLSSLLAGWLSIQS
jgi:hypothetical protein